MSQCIFPTCVSTGCVTICRPCKSPYCECESGKCLQEGYDPRALAARAVVAWPDLDLTPINLHNAPAQ